MKLSGRFVYLSTILLLFFAAVFGTSQLANAGSFDPGEFDSGQGGAVNPVSATAVFSRSSVEPGKTYAGAVIVEIAPNWHINSSRPIQDYLIPAQLEVDTLPGIIPGTISYPIAHNIPLMGESMSVYDGRAIIYFEVTIDAGTTHGNVTLPLRLNYQPCDNQTCLPPSTEELQVTFSVGTEGVSLHDDIFSKYTPATGQDNTPAGTETEKSQLQILIEEHGFWGYFLALGLAFITGLLLSFSPCTYPMIPITVSVFAGQDRSVGRGFILALFYVVSMAFMYGIMGLIVSLVGGVFGAWLASPTVVIGIAVVFVIFSLSMFGLYELNVPNSIRQNLGKQKSGGGVVGSIILGIVAALVVSPCVGPFVAGILLYIATYGSPVFGFLVLFIFAMGLGTLYLIIGTFSSAITKLPRAGMWMDQIKKFFGFVLLLMALYFLRTIIPIEVTALLTGLLLLAFSIFGGGFDRLTGEDGFFPRLKKFLGLLAFLAAVYLLLGTMLSQGFIFTPASEWLPAAGMSGAAKEQSLIDWHTDLDSGLADAKSAGKPVLIDTWATWCVNCKILEKETFNNPDVAAEAKRFAALKIQLEKSDSPESKAFLERFNIRSYSLPTVLLLDSQGNVKKIMQGVVSPEDMIAEMRKVQ
ncbi:MAG: protein-disulfide reductase DsbD [Candidatus Zixiibacteriota bacterium]